ncbi:trypsin-like serine peptidase [Sorangium sp. So ce204]|uniref:trypsin-like serine peptidase n=1 Tax=Sorangium sp. So ce204 TaxID=3133288 RepID=UPI003F64695D
MLMRNHSSRQPHGIDLLLASCFAVMPLGCAAAEAEDALLGESHDAIIHGYHGVYSAAQYFPAIGESLIYSNPADDRQFGYCTGTLIDDHTVLTAGHCVCSGMDPDCGPGGDISSSDARDSFSITLYNDGAPRPFRVPVDKWALVSKHAGIDDLALVRLKYRVPSSIAKPLPYVQWNETKVSSYCTFGYGPGPYDENFEEGPTGVKRVGVHAVGTFTYEDNPNIWVGSGDSGGPTIADWSLVAKSTTSAKIIAVNSAASFDYPNLHSARPGSYKQWIDSTRSRWDLAGLPPSLLNWYYRADFETTPGPEWTASLPGVGPALIHTTLSENGSQRFLGEYANEKLSLKLTGLPKHSSVIVSFDLYIMKTWDGNSTWWGPDVWTFSSDGQVRINTTFSMSPDLSQAYPGTYPGADHPARMGEAVDDSLGYGLAGDSVYRFRMAIPHSEGSLSLDFQGQGLTGVHNESWGLDNVSVQLVGPTLESATVPL